MPPLPMIDSGKKLFRVLFLIYKLVATQNKFVLFHLQLSEVLHSKIFDTCNQKFRRLNGLLTVDRGKKRAHEIFSAPTRCCIKLENDKDSGRYPYQRTHLN